MRFSKYLKRVKYCIIYRQAVALPIFIIAETRVVRTIFDSRISNYERRPCDEKRTDYCYL